MPFLICSSHSLCHHLPTCQRMCGGCFALNSIWKEIRARVTGYTWGIMSSISVSVVSSMCVWVWVKAEWGYSGQKPYPLNHTYLPLHSLVLVSKHLEVEIFGVVGKWLNLVVFGIVVFWLVRLELLPFWASVLSPHIWSCREIEDTRQVLIQGLLDGVGPELRIDSWRKVHIKWH